MTKLTLEFTDKEIESLRPYLYVDSDDIEESLTNFIWETIYETTDLTMEE